MSDTVSIVFGGLPCLDPVAVHGACARLGLPVGSWWGGANRFATGLGQEPGRGVLLMRKGDLDRLDREALHDLEMAVGRTRVRLRSLRIQRAVCVVSGARDDPDAPFMVAVADRRALAAGGPLAGRDYDLRDGAGEWEDASLDDGDPWTWASMLADLWETNGLMGGFPGLPELGSVGTPEGFAVRDVRSYDAIGMALEQLGCALRLDPILDAWGIVRLADADAATDAALDRLDGRPRIWDRYPVDTDGLRLAETVRVLFPIEGDAPDEAGLSHAVDVPTGGATAQAGTVAVVDGGMAALYAEESLTNEADLTARAATRAQDWLRRAGEERLSRRFAGAQPTLLPGPRLKSVAWGDTGGGLVTDAARYPGFGDPSDWLDGDEGPGEASPFPKPKDGTNGFPGPPGGVGGGPPGLPGIGTRGPGGRDGRNGRDGPPGRDGSPALWLAWLWPWITSFVRRLLGGTGPIVINAPFTICGWWFTCAADIVSTPDTVFDDLVVPEVDGKGVPVIRIVGAGPWAITGIVPQGVGQTLAIQNFTADPGILAHDNGGSAFGDRLAMPNTLDLTVMPHGGVILRADRLTPLDPLYWKCLTVESGGVTGQKDCVIAVALDAGEIMVTTREQQYANGRLITASDQEPVSIGECCAGTGITTDCCPLDPIPETLTATVDSGPCAGTYTLTWDGSAWSNLTVGGCEKIVAYCYLGLQWNIDTLASTNPAGSVTCSPFSLSASGVVFGDCCASTVTITITE